MASNCPQMSEEHNQVHSDPSNFKETQFHTISHSKINSQKINKTDHANYNLMILTFHVLYGSDFMTDSVEAIIC